MRFTLLHTGERGPDERAAFKAQVDALGADTTLLVDTYDNHAGRGQRRRAGRPPSSERCASTPAIWRAGPPVRKQLDGLGANKTPHRGVG